MNNELLDAAKEFDEQFIQKFPKIDQPTELISDFNLALNKHAQESAEHGDLIQSIRVLLSNTELEAFAAKVTQPERRVEIEAEEVYDDENPTAAEDRSIEKDEEIIGQARTVVFGNGSHDEAGLDELVKKLIDDLEADE